MRHQLQCIRYFVCFLIILSLGLCMGGCASVPKESVELSYIIGDDIQALHHSYNALIRRYFDSLRRQINQTIDHVYIPAYINDFVKTGQLVEHAKKQRADLVESWARIAVETIDKERLARLTPINEAEMTLTEDVNEAFNKVISANAIVTSHLNSIHELKGAQDEILESLELKDLRDDINDALAAASKTAKDMTDKINKAASNLNEMGE